MIDAHVFTVVVDIDVTRLDFSVVLAKRDGLCRAFCYRALYDGVAAADKAIIVSFPGFEFHHDDAPCGLKDFAGLWRCPCAVVVLEASAEASSVFEEFLHLVGEKALGFHHRHRLELLVGERKALEKVVRGELALLDEVTVVKVLGFVKFNLEHVGLAEHLERELEAVVGDLVCLCAEHHLESAETAVTNCRDHLLDHFVDFFVRFHCAPRLFGCLRL